MEKKDNLYITPGIEVFRFDAEGVICDSRPGGNIIYDEDEF